MPHPNWTLLSSRPVSDHRIFRIREDLYRFEPSGLERDFVVLESPSWVNVIPVTVDNHVVLIRQYRHGVRDVVLEIPGGVIEEGEPPETTALRELREETGYAAEEIHALGRVLPNPAIQDNYCYLFAAKGCRRVHQPTPDPFEHIEALEVPLHDIPALIRDGEISQTMVVAAFAFMGLVEPRYQASVPR